jgi:hypothetical protein
MGFANPSTATSQYEIAWNSFHITLSRFFETTARRRRSMGFAHSSTATAQYEIAILHCHVSSNLKLGVGEVWASPILQPPPHDIKSFEIPFK